MDGLQIEEPTTSKPVGWDLLKKRVLVDKAFLLRAEALTDDPKLDPCSDVARLASETKRERVRSSIHSDGQIVESFKQEEVGLTLKDAVMTMVINCVGASVLLFPRMLDDVGLIVGPILCAVCAFTCHEAGVMITNACTIAETFKGGPITGYEELAFTLGGAGFKATLIVTKNMAMLGFIVCYMQFVVDALVSFHPHEDHPDEFIFFIRWIIVTPIFCGLALITSLDQLARFNNLGLGAVFTMLACVLIGSVVAYNFFDTCDNLGELSPATKCRMYYYKPHGESYIEQTLVGGKTLSVFLFAFAILATVPSMRSQLRKPEDMHNVLRISFSIIYVLYFFVMVLGYLGFGSRRFQGPHRMRVMTNENIIVSVSNVNEKFWPVPYLASCSLITNVFISTPLIIFVVVTMVESLGTSSVHTPMTMPNCAMRFGLMFALSMVGSSLPYITEVIGLVSSLFCCCNNILFPLILLRIARSRASVKAKRPLFRIFKTYTAMAVGICVLIFGTYGSYNSLIKKMGEAAAQKATTTTSTTVGTLSSI